MDYVIGAIDYHEWADVCCWFASIKKSGFRGEVVLLVYEHTTQSAMDAFKHAGIRVVHSKSTRGVNEDRFRDLAELLSTFAPEDRVFATDVRDVVFQRNPSELLEEGLKGADLLLASEGWKFGDSAWNLDNVQTNFPERVEEIRDLEIFCAGVLAGRVGALKRLCLDTYTVSCEARSFNGDQVAMNIVIRRPEYQNSLQRLEAVNGLICHYGAVLSQRENQGASGLPLTLRVSGGLLLLENGQRVGAFHQYTRKSSVRLAVAARNGCILDFYGGKALSAINQKRGKTPQWTPYWKT